METLTRASADGSLRLDRDWQSETGDAVEDPVVERRGPRQVGAVDAQVIDHGQILTAPTDSGAR